MSQHQPDRSKPHPSSLWENLAQATGDFVNYAKTETEQAIAKKTTEVSAAIDNLTQEAGKAIAHGTTETGQTASVVAEQAGKAIVNTNHLISSAIGTTVSGIGDAIVSSVDRTDHSALKPVADLHEAVGTTAAIAGRVITKVGAIVSRSIADLSTQSSTTIVQTTADVRKQIEASTLNAKQIYNKAQEVGGGFAGAIAGETVGSTIGGIAGAMVLGPVGVVMGSQIGGFAGFVMGAQVGEEAVTQINRMGQSATEGLESFEDRLKQSFQVRGGEKIGDTVGAIVGGVVGGMTLGRPGMVVGSSVFGAVGGQIGEDWARRWHQFSLPKAQASETVPTTAWVGNTATTFGGETLSSTMGGVIGGAVLGLEGRQLGSELGLFVSRKVDWANQSSDRSDPTSIVIQPDINLEPISIAEPAALPSATDSSET